ncbi:glycosyltransferase [Treponema primitia]|uniref:glycosyltransferase n=1 Tax=Treponema primitia TaxID=88058 RepID=UPI0002555606|nr:glycosyltransferase [Treponema primitia]
MNKNICSVITVFNPDTNKLMKNIDIQLEYIDRIYLSVNSWKNRPFIDSKRITIIDNRKNIGLSKAINKCIRQAVNDCFNYTILFDQDSYLVKENFELLFNEFIAAERIQKISCIGPSLNVRNNLITIPRWTKENKTIKINDVFSVKNIITSGMLLNNEYFISLGGFDERFPVDFCDFLFCWKSTYNGYLVLQSTNAYIKHEIGTNNINIKGHTLHFHAPYRNYFLVRDTLNICLLVKETPFFIRLRFLFFLPFRMLLFLFLLENKNTRLRMYWYGLKDFLMLQHGFGSIKHILDAE